MTQHDFDVIVIGAGIGGLTAGALLANRGMKVLLVEQHSKPGGYCSTFRRGPFVFDVAVHLVGGCEEGGLVDEVLRAARVRDEVKFARVSPMYLAVRGGERVEVPSDLHEFAEVVSRFAPGETGVRSLVSKIYDIGATLLGFEGEPSPEKSFQALSGVANRSYLDFVESYVSDPRALSLLCGLAIYAGLPPAQTDAGLMISMLISYHRGAFYPRGSTQALADAFVSSITNAGGAVRLRRRVGKILLSGGRAHGVELSNGERFTARAVVSNADSTRTLFDLIGEEHLPPPFVRRLGRMKRAVSAVNLYLALDGNPGVSHHEMFNLSERHPREWQIFYRPRSGVAPFMSVSVPTLLEPALAPEGCHALAVNTFTDDPDLVERFRDEEGKDAIREDILSAAERLLPSLRSHIVERRSEVATPRTLIRYTLNTGGSALGWGKYWDQRWPHRLGPHTPVEGLYMAGHWTRGAHGIYGVVKSGKDTAAQVLKDLSG
jgi:prolycopene isomerase